MMMNYTMIALWGVVNVLQMYKMVRSIIVYEINRRRDKKLYAKNIYITRSDTRADAGFGASDPIRLSILWQDP